MQYRLSASLWGQVFAVPAVIVDKHLKLCGAVALKVILLMLRSPGEFCDVASLSQRLSLDKSDISDALNYWVEAGILEDNSAVAVEIKPTAPVLKQEEQVVAEVKAPLVSPSVSSQRIRFCRDEITQLVDKDKTLHSLVDEAQQIFGKPFTSADLDVLTALYSHYGLSAHFIVTLLHYCVLVGKRGMAYAESVATSWLNDGIDDKTVDAHIEKLMGRRSVEGKLRSAFGMDRNFITRERQFISKWFEEWNLNIELVVLAYEKTVEKTGKMAFSYMDKILSTWTQQGFKTVEQAKNEKRASNVIPTSSQADDIERMVMERFMKE